MELKSELLPFVAGSGKIKDFEKCHKRLQEFVRLLEKKTDTIWYIGSDFFENEFYERFMFHHGGFMEISFRGTIKIYFVGNKQEMFKKGLSYALTKMLGASRVGRIMKGLKVDKRLISLADSLNIEVKNGI